MPAWIIVVMVASIVATAGLTWLLWRLNKAGARKDGGEVWVGAGEGRKRDDAGDDAGGGDAGGGDGGGGD